MRAACAAPPRNGAPMRIIRVQPGKKPQFSWRSVVKGRRAYPSCAICRYQPGSAKSSRAIASLNASRVGWTSFLPGLPREISVCTYPAKNSAMRNATAKASRPATTRRSERGASCSINSAGETAMVSILPPRPPDARRPGEREVLRVEREVRVVGRVGEELVAPAPLHLLELAAEAHHLRRGGLAAAALRLAVDERGPGRPHVAQPSRAQAQAEIDVVEGDGQLFVEAAHGEVRIASHQKTRGGEGREVLRQARPAEISFRVGGEVLVAVARDAADAEDDAGVLDGAVGVQQARAHRADTGPRGVR